jgi:hypothetical protein
MNIVKINLKCPWCGYEERILAYDSNRVYEAFIDIRDDMAIHIKDIHNGLSPTYKFKNNHYV